MFSAQQQSADSAWPEGVIARYPKVRRDRMELREVVGTLHHKGTPAYEEHVKNEQRAMREHVSQQIGRPLTDSEARQLNAVVRDALDRHSRS
jgi:hypothetical protein